MFWPIKSRIEKHEIDTPAPLLGLDILNEIIRRMMDFISGTGVILGLTSSPSHTNDRSQAVRSWS
ncbi:MAG TPA: hypothetical protein ENG61_02760 [Candidatus Korarchaeota archaeon]|nr:hypothetical protein [Candidatus Korarchaeota archaeon]